MMNIGKVEYRIGDLLDYPGRFIVHGCNSQGVMNSGVAKAIRERYPLAFTRYRDTYERNGNHLSLGDVVVADCGTHVVFNAITQDRYGYDDKQYVDYEAIKQSLMTTRTIINQTADQIKGKFYPYEWSLITRSETKEQPLVDDKAIAMPLIGAGLGGGDWVKIHQILEQPHVLGDLKPIVYIKEQAQFDKVMKMLDEHL